MTYYALADCCRYLNIDPKTLHRWLAQAQVPLQPHPTDRRKSALRADHLRQLACLHHRALPALPQEPAALPASSAPPVLPADLLALPQQVATLQAHLTALQQHLAQVTALLQAPLPPPTRPAPATGPTRAPAASRPTPPPKATHVIPRVEYGRNGRYVVLCPTQGLLSLEPETPAWFAWLAEQSAFRFVGRSGHFSAHHEPRVPKGAWRAYRKIRNHTRIVRLDTTEHLTIGVLEQAAATLQAHLI